MFFLSCLEPYSYFQDKLKREILGSMPQSLGKLLNFPPTLLLLPTYTTVNTHSSHNLRVPLRAKSLVEMELSW